MHKQLTKKEQQLLKKEFLYLETEEASLFGVYCEEGFPVYYINMEAAHLLGYDSVEELIETTNGEVIQTIYWKDLSRVLHDIGTDYYEGRLFRSAHRMKRKDGSIFWAVYRGRMVRTDDGRIALLCMCTDMSRFIEQKEKLEHDKFISEAMLKNVPGGYHRCSGDEEYPLTYVSERFLEILGWTEQELEGLFERKFLRLIHPDDRCLAQTYISRLTASGSKQKYQEQIYRLKGKNGYRWVMDTTMQMEIDGEFFYQGFISDITDFIIEQEQREKKLARLERERQQNEVFAALGKIYHAIFQIDLETDSYQEIFCRDDIKAYYDYAEHSAGKVLGQLCEKVVAQKDAKRMHSFFNLSTMAQRLKDCEFVEAECVTQYGNWHRARLIAQRRNEMGCVTQVLCVTQVIDDEKQYEAHLVAKAEHADYANQSKTTFISQVAHDIQTPLNSIFGFLEIAEANAEDAQKVRYSLDKIRNAGTFLKALVSDVLDIAKMEDGRMVLQPVEVSLTQLAEEFTVAMQNTRPDKQQIFRMNVRNICHDWILADPLRLKQIYTNVAANAIKYTPNGGIIDCCICQEEIPGTDRVRVVTTISDTGIGMSDAFMEKMFTKFERETDTRINKINGYGLGLPIVKELVDLMGGLSALSDRSAAGNV